MSNGGPRRGSIFPGLLLIVIGVLFLLDRFDPAFGLGHLIRLYWPVLIIIWGVAKLIDHFAAQRAGEPRAALLSGGEAALMIFLAFVFAGFIFRDWIREHNADIDIDLPLFHESYSQTRELPPLSLPAGAHIVIDTERGDVSVRATDASDLRITAKQSARAASQSASDEQTRKVEVVVDQNGNTYHVHSVKRGQVWSPVTTDLNVDLPKSASVEISTGHGDVDVAGTINGDIVVRSASGDIKIEKAGADVSVVSQRGDVRIAEVAGNAKLSGRGDDVDISNVTGDATIEGAFVGSIRASNIARTFHCASPWSDLTVTQLTGRLEADSGDITLTGANGSVKLTTRNKDINVKNVAGRIEITNTHGDVKVTYSGPPREDLNVTNASGDMDVTLPAGSNFSVSAVSNSGEVASDFSSASLKALNENSRGEIMGQYGGPGPKLTISTSYGTIHLRKSG